jgi:hypothetical protein
VRGRNLATAKPKGSIMKSLSEVELWDFCRGMNWVWDYCSSGTAESNAKGVQSWVERSGKFTASLKVCRKVCAAISRHSRGDSILRVGYGFGESTLF